MNPQQSPEDARLLELCRSAFHAEYRGQFAEAQNIHRSAIAGLQKLVNDAGFFDRERKRVARKQIKFHSERVTKLAPVVAGTKPQLDVVLPTALSAQDELTWVAPNGRLPIALEEIWLSGYLANKATNPNLPPEPGMEHLLQNPVPFYTPTLDPSLPNETYHIYSNGESVFPAGLIYYLKVKSATDDKQTLYVLQARKSKRYQIPLATLHRSTEFLTPCVQVQIEPVKPESSAAYACMKGRALTLHTVSRRPIVEQPDRREKPWATRRFSYAGRQFAWEAGKNPLEGESLYEVESVWPKPGSKTGKKEHKRVGRALAWGESKARLKKVGQIYMVGGLDQAFREYILASQLTRMAVVMFGHD